MSYILYNDDFRERPPSRIPIPANYTESHRTGWLGIFEQLFQSTNASYSVLATATESDLRRKASIVSDVEATLNKTLSKAWKIFQLDQTTKIAVRLTVSTEQGESAIGITIVERMGDKERFFEVVDRSKGFLWFYNFVMKLEFNPKLSYADKDTIYLLDEPGSYLHPAAQGRLCAKLRAISERHGHVIFCTHSHHLLKTDLIPINSIYVVRKSSGNRIAITPLPLYDTASVKLTALQPIFEALQMPAYDFPRDGAAVVLVEGIYDMYVLKLFLPKSGSIRVLPGTGASSIVKNIPFMLLVGQKYVALWDNDGEGRRSLQRAEKFFGPHEAKRFASCHQGKA